MKKIIQILSLILISSIAQAQIKDAGPEAYFGYLGLDSMKRIELLQYDTLKMDNQNLKVIRFMVALSCYDCGNCRGDVFVVPIEGNAISTKKDFFKSLQKSLSQNILLTIWNIEFMNPQGKLIKYPREFSFKLY